MFHKKKKKDLSISVLMITDKTVKSRKKWKYSPWQEELVYLRSMYCLCMVGVCAFCMVCVLCVEWVRVRCVWCVGYDYIVCGVCVVHLVVVCVWYTCYHVLISNLCVQHTNTFLLQNRKKQLQPIWLWCGKYSTWDADFNICLGTPGGSVS